MRLKSCGIHFANWKKKILLYAPRWCCSSPNKHIKRKAFSLPFPTMHRCSLTRGDSQSKWPALCSPVSPLLFSIWKAAHTLTGHLASAVMTQANPCYSHKWMWKQARRGSETTFVLFLHVWMWGAAGGKHITFLSNTTCMSLTMCVLLHSAYFKAYCLHTCMHVSTNGPEDLEMRSFLHIQAFFSATLNTRLDGERAPQAAHHNLNIRPTQSESWKRCQCLCTGLYVGLSDEKRARLAVQSALHPGAELLSSTPRYIEIINDILKKKTTARGCFYSWSVGFLWRKPWCDRTNCAVCLNRCEWVPSVDVNTENTWTGVHFVSCGENATTRQYAATKDYFLNDSPNY